MTLLLLVACCAVILFASTSNAFQSLHSSNYRRAGTQASALHMTLDANNLSTRRNVLFVATAAATAIATSSPATALGPVKIGLVPTSYTAQPCPPDKPIPGQKAMAGMRGLCVTVKANLKEASPKVLDKVGVYGFVIDAESGDSVLANNPDLSTDAGQFAMIPVIKTTDKTIEFEFVAAVPAEKDLSKYKNGIGELEFSGLKLISFPGGDQFGAINPCEMNEFSQECEDWEDANGPYKKSNYMMKSNPRTKGG